MSDVVDMLECIVSALEAQTERLDRGLAFRDLEFANSVKLQELLVKQVERASALHDLRAAWKRRIASMANNPECELTVAGQHNVEICLAELDGALGLPVKP